MKKIKTFENFRERVIYSDKLSTFMGITLGILVVLFFKNFISAAIGIMKNGIPIEHWGNFFMSTTSEKGSYDPILCLMVYGPIVLFFPFLISFIIHKSTKKKRVRIAYDEYLENGNVMRYIPLNMEVKIPGEKKKLGRLCILENVEKEGQDLETEINYLNDKIKKLDKREYKVVERKISKLKFSNPKPLYLLFPGIPEELLGIVSDSKIGREVVIINNNNKLKAYFLNPKK